MEFSVSTESNYDSIIAKNCLLRYALALSGYECLKCNPALSMSGLFSWILALPSKNKAVCSCINKACDKHTTLKNIPGKCFKKKKTKRRRSRNSPFVSLVPPSSQILQVSLGKRNVCENVSSKNKYLAIVVQSLNSTIHN